MFFKPPQLLPAGGNGLPLKAVPPTWQSFPSMSRQLVDPRWRIPKGWCKRLLNAGKMTSSVKKRFPTLADFRAKRKIMRQDRHFVSRDETIGSREHSNIRKYTWL